MSQTQTEFPIGTYIDLRYLNRKREAAPSRKKSKGEETARRLLDVGSSFTFQMINGQLQGFLRIPVQFA